ncbi:hypothetical protein Pmani_009191 [Petrolisthes manimaculis]|uniref:Uncharacterized protein n=1 Tax=Petrolisthes manimaculis TaxID=1843537 RepID=A0AAE1Q5B4_9EUCA|nr:hypothetical protein Pmani_009191 [Petrolisthes manimaculis]
MQRDPQSRNSNARQQMAFVVVEGDGCQHTSSMKGLFGHVTGLELRTSAARLHANHPTTTTLPPPTPPYVTPIQSFLAPLIIIIATPFTLLFYSPLSSSLQW